MIQVFKNGASIGDIEALPHIKARMSYTFHPTEAGWKEDVLSAPKKIGNDTYECKEVLKLSRENPDPFDLIHPSPRSVKRRAAQRLHQLLSIEPRSLTSIGMAEGRTVSYRLLHDMEQAGLLSADRSGKETIYSAVPLQNRPHDVSSFGEAIAASKGKDHLPTLVLADYLEENGRGEEAGALRTMIEHMGGVKIRKGSGTYGVKWPLEVHLGTHVISPRVTLEQKLQELRELRSGEPHTWPENRSVPEGSSQYPSRAAAVRVISHALLYGPKEEYREAGRRMLEGMVSGRGHLIITSPEQLQFDNHWASKSPSGTITIHHGKERLSVIPTNDRTRLSRERTKTIILFLNGKRIGTVILPSYGPPTFYGGASLLFGAIPSAMIDSGHGTIQIPNMGVVQVVTL